MTTQTWRQGTLMPLIVPDYRRLLTGTVLWWQCFHMEMVVLGWLVFDLTSSARAVALVGFCRTLPLLLLGLFSSALIDRFGRRRVVIAAQGVNLAAYATLALLLWRGQAALWQIALIAFVLGAAWAVDWPARRGLVPDLLTKDRMVDGMLVESFLTGIGRFLSPALAGWLIARYGAMGCYSVMALLSLVALIMMLPLLLVPAVRTAKGQNPSILTGLGEGLRYVRANQTILAVLLVTLFMNLWIFPYISLLPIFTKNILQQGPVELGFLSTASGLGAFLGLLLITWLRRAYSIGLLFIVGTTWCCLSLIGFALSHHYPVSWLMLFSSGIGVACFGTLQSAIILQSASDEMRSRVMGLLVLAIGGDPLGQLQIGWLAERFGVQATLAGQASAATLVLGLIVLLLPGIRRPQSNDPVERHC